VVVGGVAAWFLATGPLLSVRSVEVRGEVAVDSEGLQASIERAARRGTMISPATGAIRQAALAHPGVESVAIRRELPLGLVVRVTPAPPVAVAEGGGERALVDRHGHVVGPAEEGAGLPLLTLESAPPKPGGVLESSTRAPLALAASAPPDLGRRLRGLRVEGARLSGRLAKGPELRLGAPDEVASKAAALAAVVDQLSPAEERAAAYVDLSEPSRPAVGGLPAPAPEDPDDESLDS
jgi:cell division septal protein FtsQ